MDLSGLTSLGGSVRDGSGQDVTARMNPFFFGFCFFFCHLSLVSASVFLQIEEQAESDTFCICTVHVYNQE